MIIKMERDSSQSDDGEVVKRPDVEHGFLVVGIGASAGGIQALSQFFSNVRPDTGMAYVVILHLSPDHDSQLAHVLQQTSKIPVEQVTRKTKIAPNRVYVVPPDRSLAMLDGHIIVNPLKTVEERRAPVDIFFRTLAESHGPNAIGVILSGTGANGSMGLKRIKELGGATFAQNPREAEFNEMPRNAIATSLVDSILPVAEIAEQIITYRNRIGHVSIPDKPEERPDDQQNALRDIFTQLRVRTGHDFSNYKRPTMLRRIERRIGVRNLPDLPAYVNYLRENPEEPVALLKDLLISVTNFFRDKKAFEALEKKTVPRLLADREPDKPVRIWTAGCATGEEAYSLAILFAERTIGDVSAPIVQVFATDIDQQAIAVAREGLYTLNDAADVSPERLRRFFTKEGDNYRVRREIREMVLFARHNLIKDPPFSHLDLVSCRNLLIYLNHTAQESVMERIHFALKPGGYIFIGSSESVDGSGDLFAPVDKKNHIFQSRQVTARRIPVPESAQVYQAALKSADERAETPKPPLERISYTDLHLRLLEEFVPPSLVVNEDYEIMHLSENAGKYLQVVGGEPTNNLLKLIRPDIRVEVRGALFQARQQKSNVEVPGLKIRRGDRTEVINLLIRPVISDTDTARGYIVVIFQPAMDGGDRAENAEYVPPEPVARQLEEELVRSRRQLRSALEQAEVQSEDLRASNEELQAMNEELRSSAEELETGKEELQSINEEMITVNQELKIKIEELSHTNNNFQNLLNSIDIGVIFLDRSLRVNLFSPAARGIFNLLPNDIGRSLSDITSRITYFDLAADADKVIASLQTIEREVQSVDNTVFLMRMFPYRTTEDRINGVVVTFVDITVRKRAEEALHTSEERLQRMMNIPRVGVLTFDYAGTMIHANDAFLEMVGYTRREFESKAFNWRDFTPDEYVEESQRIMEQLRETRRGGPYEKEYVRKDGSRKWMMFVASDLGDGTIIEYAVDVSDRRQAEEAIRFHAQLLNSVEQSVIATDTEGKVIFWNRFAEDMFGWLTAEAMGRDIMELTMPDTMIEQGEEIMNRVRRNQSWEGEFLVKRRDGSVFSAHVVDSPVSDANGNLIAIVGVSIDLEERREMEEALRQSEERLRLLMESFTDYAITTTDAKGIVENWNPGAEKIFGYSAEEMIGKSLDIVFTPEDRAGNAPEEERSAALEKGRAADERWHLRKNGERFFASGVMVPLYDQGRLLGYAKIARDLTEQKRVGEQLQQSREELEKRVAERTKELKRSNETLREEIAERKRTQDERIGLLRKIVTTQEDERSRIAREIHDQLGQRLTALRLKIAAVKDLCKDEQLCERVGHLEELGVGLDKEVSFLAWELRPAVLDDLGLAAAIENYVREWSQHFEIPTEFHTTGLKRKRLDAEIETNLYRILQEGLNNIAKHSKAKQANVLLERRKKEIVLIIEDNGIGFDPAKASRVRKSGHGLGIIGMRERAAICGGSVEIESAPGQGTTLFVRVPAKFAETGGQSGN